MTHLDFFKKLKVPEPTSGILGCFFFSLCLICCLFFLDYRVGLRDLHLHGESLLSTWFKSNDSSSSLESVKLGFLDGDCDIFQGNWVWDESYPLYQSRDCVFLDEGFRCTENGRPDVFYTKWRWQPHDCNLPRSLSCY